MEDFIHLHVHTYYSILDGQSKIKSLVDKAIADGQRGMAITDHGDMYGIKEFHDYVNGVNKKRKKEGLEPFKPIFGCEMYVAKNGPKEQKEGKQDQGGYHLIVLAKNETGYRNLIKIVSNAWVDGFYMRPRTDRADLESHHEGLIVCSACIAGEVPAKILKDDIAGAREAIEWHKRVFGDDYYLELQRHEVKDPTIRANRETFPLQQKANKVIIELAHEYGIKLVCTNDAHFVDKENAEAHDHLLCLSTGKDIDDPERMLYSKQEWFKTKEEMWEVFNDVPEAMANTIEILDKVETYSLDNDPIMPFFPIPESFGTEEEWRKKFTEQQLYDEFTSDENGENQLSPEEGEKKIKKLGGYDKIYRIKFEADYLAKLAYEGAKKRYTELTDEILDRIKFELHIMKTMGFPGYFLIVQDFINSARDELGVMVGPGRGSAAGSVVAYCLGITKIDPLKYDLLFERFLNPDRISLPDIDTDFDDDGRGKVLKWVEDKYGHENCAHIITYATMATKNSLKDVARVEKVPIAVSNALCKAIPDRLPDGMKMNLPNAIKCTKELQEAEVSDDQALSNTIKYAKMLEGTVRGTGIHACGFIICRDPISDHVPLSTADDPDFKGTKTNCTQYDGHVIESTGLIKMDFLGLITLSIIHNCLNLIQERFGEDIDIEAIPIDDKPTYELYGRGDTVSVFQFESEGMQTWLQKLRPTRFEDLIAMNALYRPGPMDYIPDFVARKQGEQAIEYDLPEMAEYLEDTYGVTVYQEQVMLLSQKLAGFTKGEADKLRKAMGKKQIDILNSLKGKFMEGGMKNGHPEKILDKIWKDWEKFAQYAFNKSHATCYAWVSYQTGWLKCHYPSEFFASCLTWAKSMEEIKKIMDDARGHGIRILSPDVNESSATYTVNKDGDVRFSLGGMKGFGANIVDLILKDRDENGLYTDIYDFVERMGGVVNRKAFETLLYAGALDGFGIKRRQYELPGRSGQPFIDEIVRYGELYRNDTVDAAASLFGDIEEMKPERPTVPEMAGEEDYLGFLQKEKELVGMYLSSHPLDKYRFEMDNFTTCELANLANLVSECELAKKPAKVCVAGLVTDYKQLLTKKGAPYSRTMLEDYSGSYELTLFTKEHEQFFKYMVPHDALFLEGVIEERYFLRPEEKAQGKTVPYTFKLQSVTLLGNVAESRIKAFGISIETPMLTPAFREGLVKVIRKHKGSIPLEVFFFDPDTRYRIQLKSNKYQVAVSEELLTDLRHLGVDQFEVVKK